MARPGSHPSVLWPELQLVLADQQPHPRGPGPLQGGSSQRAAVPTSQQPCSRRFPWLWVSDSITSRPLVRTHTAGEIPNPRGLQAFGKWLGAGLRACPLGPRLSLLTVPCHRHSSRLISHFLVLFGVIFHPSTPTLPHKVPRAAPPAPTHPAVGQSAPAMAGH